jgi:hypothetical protein
LHCDPDASVGFSSSRIGSWGAQASSLFQQASCERIRFNDPEGRENFAGGEVSVANENHRLYAIQTSRPEGREKRP